MLWYCKVWAAKTLMDTIPKVLVRLRNGVIMGSVVGPPWPRSSNHSSEDVIKVRAWCHLGFGIAQSPAVLLKKTQSQHRVGPTKAGGRAGCFSYELVTGTSRTHKKLKRTKPLGIFVLGF